MLEAIIKTSTIYDTVKSMSALVDEARFEITSDGISACAVDAANASMAAIDIPKSVFDEFSVTECELGIDLPRLVEIIAMFDKDGVVEMSLDEDTHKLNIGMGGLSYTMSLLDPSTLRKAPNIPELDLPAEITLSGAVFKRMIKAAAMVGDHMRIGCKGSSFVMEAKGDTDDVHLDLAGSDLISIKPADVSSLYSLDYLSSVGKGIGTSGEVVINIGRDLPVVIEFEVGEDCSVTYVLAPRIEDD